MSINQKLFIRKHYFLLENENMHVAIGLSFPVKKLFTEKIKK